MKKLLLVTCLLACQLRGAIALVDHQTCHGDGTGACSVTINTTGATLLTAVVTEYFADATVPSLNTGTWSSSSNFTQNSANVSIRYLASPTQSGTLAINMTGGSAQTTVFIQSWSGTETGSVLQGSIIGASVADTTIQPGSVTPVADGYLVLTGMATTSLPTGAFSIDSGFTIADERHSVSVEYGGAAYLLQSTAAAVNPTWTLAASGPVDATATIAVFKASAAAPATPKRRMIQ